MNKEPSGKSCGKVLVLGNDNRSFLTVIRSLARKQICVHVAWCDKKLYALKSKYISKVHSIPRFSRTSDEWKKHLIQIMEKEKYDLVIPCSDPVIIPLQCYKEEFDNISKVYLLDNSTYEVANDKYKMQKTAYGLGVKVAKEVSISKVSKIDEIISAINLPVVIKPRSSFTKDEINKKRHVVKIYTDKGLKRVLTEIKDNEVLVAQENFNGLGAGIELLSDNGNILVAFQHIRIHEPLTGGGSSYRKSVQPFPELLSASKKIIKAINYTGVGMVEFKIDPKTNKWIFIEFNARFWGSLPLPVSCGIDFPYYLYLMLVRETKNFPTAYKSGIYCRNTSLDINWFISNLKADRTDPTLATLPIWKVFLEIFNLVLLKERNDTLVIDDLKPGIAELGDLLKRFLNKISMKIFFFRIKLLPYRILKNYKTISILTQSTKILFICKGNICRSPFAHFYMRSKNIENIEIDSCGYYPKEGRSCPKEAVEVARKYGIDLSRHRSKVADDYLTKTADIIFVFDEENYKFIMSKNAEMKNKTFMLSFLKTTIPFNIKDPYGLDIDYFDKTFSIIKMIVDLIENNILNRKKLA